MKIVKQSQLTDLSFRQPCDMSYGIFNYCSLSYCGHPTGLSALSVHPGFCQTLQPPQMPLSLPASPICPSLCPIFPRCLGLTAVLSSTSYCRVMLPASLNTGKIPIICLWPLLLPPFSSHPAVRSLRSCLHPKGVLAAPKLQLQRRIGAAVIP